MNSASLMGSPTAYRDAAVPRKVPEVRRVLGVAFEMVCIALQIEGSDDFVKQAIATKIINLAKSGERNPDILCE
jgi:hypothetical protein